MAKYKLVAFGIAREIMGSGKLEFDSDARTVGELRSDINVHFPRMEDLNSLFIAVNEAYADDHQSLSETDEIALIPPVSGG